MLNFTNEDKKNNKSFEEIQKSRHRLESYVKRNSEGFEKSEIYYHFRDFCAVFCYSFPKDISKSNLSFVITYLDSTDPVEELRKHLKNTIEDKYKILKSQKSDDKNTQQ